MIVKSREKCCIKREIDIARGGGIQILIVFY